MKEFALRLLTFLFGLLLLSGVSWLGYLSGSDPKIIPWFGIAAAIAAPLGLTALAYGIKGRKEKVLDDLKKVPEIQRLIVEAKTREEQLRILEAEHNKLSSIIASESRRQTLESRRVSIEDEARRLVQEADAIDKELLLLNNNAEKGLISRASIEELSKLIRARTKGDIILRFGSRNFIIERDLFLAIPGGSFFYNYMRLLQYISDFLKKK